MDQYFGNTLTKPSFNLTIEGQASVEVPADRAVVKINLSSWAKTEEQAKASLAAKITDLESQICKLALTGSPLPTSSTAPKHDRALPIVNGWSKPDRDEDDNLDFVMLKGNKKTGPNSDSSKAATDGAVSDAANVVPQPLDYPRKLTIADLGGLSGIVSCTRSDTSITVGTTSDSSGRKKSKKKYVSLDESLVGLPEYDGCKSGYTATASYSITFDDISGVSKITWGIHRGMPDCYVCKPELSAFSTTRKAVEPRLRQAAVRDALLKIRDYCIGMRCNARTTKIVPTDIMTLSTRVDDTYYGPHHYQSSHPDRIDDPFAALFESAKQQAPEPTSTMVKVKHRVEVTFKIEMDELTLADIVDDE